MKLNNYFVNSQHYKKILKLKIKNCKKYKNKINYKLNNW